MDGGIRREQSSERGALAAEGAAHGGDDAYRDRMIVAEGIADGDGGFSGHNVRRIGHADRGQIVRAPQFEPGDVEIGIGALD